MSTARIPDGTPLGLVQVGATIQRAQSTPGRSDTPVKPTSEVAHQPGQHRAADWAYCRKDMNLMHRIGYCPYDPPELRGPCGGVQHREIKSAGQTTGGACGGTRLGNPCGQDGLTR